MKRSLTPVRVAVAGCGYFSRFHYNAWRRISEARLVGVCDIALERAQSFADEFSIPASFDTLDAMLRESKPDLLDIVLPPAAHLEAIRAAARAGVDVICQKPFCANLEDAKLALALAEEAGISIAVHENFRFQPWYEAIHSVLRSGRLGQVYQATFRLRPGDGQGPEAYLARQPYFQMMPRFLVHETAIHQIDVFRYLFGEPAAVTAALKRLNPAIAGEDSGLFILDMRSGVRCIFDGNRLVDHPAENRRLTMGELLIEGEKGSLQLNGYAELSFRLHGENRWEPVHFTWSDVDFGGDCVYRLQAHVIGHRLGREPMQNSARDYLKNIMVEEAVYASHEEGRRIDF